MPSPKAERSEQISASPLRLQGYDMRAGAILSFKNRGGRTCLVDMPGNPMDRRRIVKVDLTGHIFRK